MRRREFIKAVAASAASFPLAAHAQQSGGKKRVAILNGNPETPTSRARVTAFQQGLAKAGWQEGRNISFEVRWGGADAARIDAYANELVKLNPDAILATNTPTARSLKRASDTIPIVFAPERPDRRRHRREPCEARAQHHRLHQLQRADRRKMAGAREGAFACHGARRRHLQSKTAPHAIFLPVMQDIAPRLGVTVMTLPVSDRAAIETAFGQLAREPPIPGSS